MTNSPARTRNRTGRNLAVGSALQLWEMSTLGIVFDNLKTVMAAHRGDTLGAAARRIYAKGGVGAFYRGLIPWAWVEAATKGGVLLVAQSGVTSRMRAAGASPEAAGAVGGIAGGICQAYTTMGFCTFFRTVEISRGAGPRTESVLGTAARVLRNEGIRGVYKGVNAVALRQATNWGSRFGFSRLLEGGVRRLHGDAEHKLSRGERVAASAIGGGLACWNQPLEVVRVEMQLPREGRALSMGEAVHAIYKESGVWGFYRGVAPRVALSVYLTIVMVFGGDEVKAMLERRGL